MMYQMICEVSPGLRNAEASIKVKDYSGSSEYFPLDRGMLSQDDGSDSIPVTLIQYNSDQTLALVGLPVEADSGSNRIWVKAEDLTEALEPVY